MTGSTTRMGAKQTEQDACRGSASGTLPTLSLRPLSTRTADVHCRTARTKFNRAGPKATLRAAFLHDHSTAATEAGPRHAVHEAAPDWVNDLHEDDWNAAALAL